MRYLPKDLFLGIAVLIVLFLTNIPLVWAPDGTRPPHPGREAPITKPSQRAPEPERGIHQPFSINILDFRPATPDISLGDEQTLHWRVYLKNIRDLRMEITPRIRITPLRKETAPEVITISLPKTDYIGKEAWLEDKIRIRPEGTTTYILRVTGKGIGLGGVITPVEQTASVEVKVRRPKLEIVQPEVDEKNKELGSQFLLKITFFAKNTGDGEFHPTPITVNYRIEGLRGTAAPAILKEGTFTTYKAIGIGIGQKVYLGEIKLYDSEREKFISYNELKIITRIGANYALPLEGDENTFIYRWKYPDLIVSSLRIERIGEIEIHREENFPPTHKVKCKIIAKVKNQGGAPSGPCKANLREWYDDPYLGRLHLPVCYARDVSGLAPGQEIIFCETEHYLLLPHVVHTFQGEVDVLKDVDESNEFNNDIIREIRFR